MTANNTKTSAESPEEILQFVRSHFETARKKVESAHAEIKYNREMYLNTTLRTYWDDPEALTEDERRRVFRSAAVATKIDAAVAIQTDNRPAIFINPEPPAPGDAAVRLRHIDKDLHFIGGLGGLAETLSRVFNNWWDENRVEEHNYLLVKEARVCGASIAKVYWNPDARRGAGDVVFERIPIEDFIPDPDARDIDDSRFCFHTKIMPLAEVAAKYGVSPQSIEPDSDFSDLFEDRHKNDPDDGLKYRHPKVLLVESYFHDNSLAMVAGPDGQTATVPKYPGGRIITFVGSTLLRDEPNPYPEFPFIKFTSNPIPGAFFGKPDARDLAPIQENADLIMQQILENMRLVGNAKIIYEEGALTDPDSLTNLIAEKVPVTRLGAVQFIPPQSAAADGHLVYERLLRLADEISGIHEVSDGRRPAGVTSGRAIISLQEGTNRRLRPAARFFESFLQRVARKVVWLMIRNYRKGRLYRFGPDRSQCAALPIDLSDLDITFDITVGANSSLPSDKISRSNLALQLINIRAEDGLPIIDRQYLLKHLELPGADELLTRINQHKQNNGQPSQHDNVDPLGEYPAA